MRLETGKKPGSTTPRAGSISYSGADNDPREASVSQTLAIFSLIASDQSLPYRLDDPFNRGISTTR